MKTEKILIYYDGGEDYKGEDLYNRKIEIALAKEKNQIGYLTGHRYYSNSKDKVMCFFKEKPDEKEIQRRRGNGFIGAKWVYI